MKRYITLWWLMTLHTSQTAFASRLGACIFILGKVLRFFFFLAFLFVLASKTKIIAGYTLEQMILFFLTFNLVDTLPQFFLREVYRFRNYVVTGDFDYFLLRPISPLFRSLFGGSDVFDLSILLLSIAGIWFASLQIPSITLFQILLYIILIINAFFIAMSLHIIVLSIGVVSTEVDNAIMLYRDLTQMGRVPIDIYKEPFRDFITFVIPVGIMMTVPAKALFGLLNIPLIITAACIAFLFLSSSIFIWHTALREYSSASS